MLLLIRAKECQVGDKLSFINPQFNYVIEDIKITALGWYQHSYNNETASSTYKPEELVYVERTV